METLKSANDEINQLTNTGYGNEPIATILVEYIQMLYDYKMYRLAIKKIDESLSLLLTTSDYSSIIHAQFLKYKLIALWKLRESVRIWRFKKKIALYEKY